MTGLRDIKSEADLTRRKMKDNCRKRPSYFAGMWRFKQRLPGKEFLDIEFDKSLQNTKLKQPLVLLSSSSLSHFIC